MIRQSFLEYGTLDDYMLAYSGFDVPVIKQLSSCELTETGRERRFAFFCSIMVPERT